VKELHEAFDASGSVLLISSQKLPGVLFSFSFLFIFFGKRAQRSAHHLLQTVAIGSAYPVAEGKWSSRLAAL
jgi:hypothetical protein